MTRNARRIKKLMKRDPHCHWCGVEVIYYLVAIHEVAPPNFATIDHLISRFNMEERLRLLRESKKRKDGSHYVLACRKCNEARAAKEEREVLYGGQV